MGTGQGSGLQKRPSQKQAAKSLLEICHRYTGGYVSQKLFKPAKVQKTSQKADKLSPSETKHHTKRAYMLYKPTHNQTLNIVL